MHALSIFERPTIWAISSVNQDSPSSDMPSRCRRPVSADVHLVATNASTTRGSTSARCPQAPTGLSVTSARLPKAAHCVVREPEYVQ